MQVLLIPGSNQCFNYVFDFIKNLNDNYNYFTINDFWVLDINELLVRISQFLLQNYSSFLLIFTLMFLLTLQEQLFL